MNRLRSRRAWRVTAALSWGISALAVNACSGDAATGTNDNATDGDSGAGDGSTTSDGGQTIANDGSTTIVPEGGIALTCAETTSPIAPNACPAASGTAGHVDFCFRPQWSGVTGVDVFLSANGQAADWSTPFTTLKNDGSGTFTGSSALANGTYPYLFRVHGSADGLVKDGQYLLDQENPSFTPPPTGSPVQRSVSQLTVPQVANPIYHVRGKVVFAGVPQSCYALDLEAGELVNGSTVVSEHTTANFAESAADGTFDFPVAAGPLGVVVRYPFKLVLPDGGYPDPTSVPSVGVTRANFQVVSSDLALDPADVAYSESAYAKMAPTTGTATLPVTFTYPITPGAESAEVAVIGTNIAGNDPDYNSGFSTVTSLTWDGGFNGPTGVVDGTTYYWGTWEKTNPLEDGGTEWNAESLLFPITFH